MQTLRLPCSRVRLKQLRRLNLRTGIAWLLKEGFAELWNCTDKRGARAGISRWCWMATHSRLTLKRDFAWTLRWQMKRVLAWFDHPISNGVVEGLNNKAKAVAYRCYGFRTAGTFLTNPYHCLGKLPETALVHRFL